MTDPTASVPAPNPPAAPWIVEPSTERVELRDGRAEVTFTVKNPQATTQRAVFEVVPGDAVAPTWFTIEGERQRPIEANQSTQFKVALAAPAGTPVASYWFQARVYAADVAPEESSTLSNRVTFSVSTPTEKTGGGFPWWIIAVIAALVVVIGVVVFLVTRDDGPPDFPPPRLVAPADGTKFDSSTSTVSLAWEPVDGAAKYSLRVVAPSCRDKLQVTNDPLALAPTTTTPVETTLPPDMPISTFVLNPDLIQIRPDSRLTICAILPDVPFEPVLVTIPGTSFDLTFETEGRPTSVQWSVTPLDGDDVAGPTSEVRTFSFVPSSTPPPSNTGIVPPFLTTTVP